MRNPWSPRGLDRVSNSYVLASDAHIVERFNKKNLKPEYRIQTGHIPEPWLGVVTAEVVVLQLNPRYCSNDMVDVKKLRYIGKQHRPHFGLTSGPNWWTRCCKQLAVAVGKIHFSSLPPCDQLAKAYARISTRICSIEYFPYGSQNFNHSHVRVPSQRYSFALVRRSMNQGAHIVILKGAKHWESAIPRLKNYSPKIIARGFGNRGAKHITPWSCGGNLNFQAIVARL